MLEPKVRLLIGWFPFKTEAYARAKNTSTSKYGKVSEVVKAHVQVMMALPIVMTVILYAFTNYMKNC